VRCCDESLTLGMRSWGGESGARTTACAPVVRRRHRDCRSGCSLRRFERDGGERESVEGESHEGDEVGNSVTSLSSRAALTDSAAVSSLALGQYAAPTWKERRRGEDRRTRTEKVNGSPYSSQGATEGATGSTERMTGEERHPAPGASERRGIQGTGRRDLFTVCRGHITHLPRC
jgi:hypothetical protein